MKQPKTLLWAYGIVALAVLGGGTYFFVSGPGSEAPVMIAQDDMPRYRAGDLEISVSTDPGIPRVGDNRLIVDVRDPNGNPVSVTIEGFAEMPAMGTMQAMRAPADLHQTDPGRYEGSLQKVMYVVRAYGTT